MKEKIKIYIILLVIIGVLIGGFLIWWNYQKTIERKYQACLEKCEAEYTKPGLSRYLFPSLSPEHKACRAGCKEKYAK